MAFSARTRPVIVLVDDDPYSARLLRRTLRQFGPVHIKWFGKPVRALKLLGETLQPHSLALVIADLKATSTATADLVRELRHRLPSRVPIVAMALSLERSARDALLEAGASAVFERAGDPAAYRREVAGIAALIERQRHRQGARPPGTAGSVLPQSEDELPGRGSRRRSATG